MKAQVAGLLVAGLVLVFGLNALAHVTAGRLDERGYGRMLDGTWDQACTQMAFMLRPGPDAAHLAAMCRENRFQPDLERFLVGGDR